MIITALIVLWSVVTLLAWRPIGGHLAWASARDWGQDEPDSFDRILLGVLGGFAVAAVAPALLGLYLLYSLGGVIASLAGKKLPIIGAEKEMREKKRIKELQRLERELGYD